MHNFPLNSGLHPTIYIAVSGRLRKSFRDWRENGEGLTRDRLIVLVQGFPSALATLTLLRSFQIGWASQPSITLPTLAFQTCVLPIYPVLASTCPASHLPRPQIPEGYREPEVFAGACPVVHPSGSPLDSPHFDAALLSVSLWHISAFSAHQFLFLSRIWPGT